MTKIHCNLCDPKTAREYILNFKVGGETPTYVKFNTCREVHFETMSDKEAVDIAHQLYEMEKEAHSGRVI